MLVPAHLAVLEVTLSGEVERLSSPGDTQQVSATYRVELNKQDNTNYIEDLYLASGRPGTKDKYGRESKLRRSGEAAPESEEGEEGKAEGAWSYSLYCLGKSGEPIGGRLVRLRLTHDMAREPLPHQPWMDLATDAQGRIELGPLPHIVHLSATILGASSGTGTGAGANAVPKQHRWDLRSNMQSMQRSFVIQAGGPALEIPFASARSSLNDVEELAGAPSLVLFEQMADGQLGSALDAEKHVALVLGGAKRVIRVGNLAPGRYLLLCKAGLWFNDGQPHAWPIRVVAGPLLMQEYVMDKRSKQFVRTEKPQIQQTGPLQIVSASTVTAEKATATETATKTGGGAEVVLQLAGVSPSTRVHVVATHFHPTSSSLQSSFCPHALAVSEGRLHRGSLGYATPPSVYMPQKQLGDELTYILDRSLAVAEQRRMGNMLPRPSLLMNERFKRKTRFSDEPTLHAGEVYTAADVAASAPAPPQRSFFAPEALMMGGALRGQREQLYMSPSGSSMDDMAAASGCDRCEDASDLALLDDAAFGGGSNGGGGGSADIMEAMASVGIVDGDSLGGDPASRMQLEFLARPSVLLANLRPDAQSQTLRIPLSAFAPSHLQLSIVALDSVGQVSVFRHALRDASSTLRRSANTTDLALDAAFRDTRLLAALDPSKRFAERALITCLATGESLALSSSSSSSPSGTGVGEDEGRLETFDTLGELWTLLSTLARAGGRQGPSIADHLSKFEFLPRWGALSAANKEALFSRWACHELSLFLYFKDRPFFQRVVQPMLRSKLRKTFVDWFLIAENDLSTYLRPHAFDTLNTFERMLLAIRLHSSPQARHVKAAESILDLIMHSAQAWCNEDRAADAAFFQTALLSKALGASAPAPPPKAPSSDGEASQNDQEQSSSASSKLMQPPSVEMMMKRSAVAAAPGGGFAPAPQAFAMSPESASASSSSFDC